MHIAQTPQRAHRRRRARAIARDESDAHRVASPTAPSPTAPSNRPAPSTARARATSSLDR